MLFQSVLRMPDPERRVSAKPRVQTWFLCGAPLLLILVRTSSRERTSLGNISIHSSICSAPISIFLFVYIFFGPGMLFFALAWCFFAEVRSCTEFSSLLFKLPSPAPNANVDLHFIVVRTQNTYERTTEIGIADGSHYYWFLFCVQHSRKNRNLFHICLFSTPVVSTDTRLLFSLVSF